ncbi:phage major capsid protein [Hydrogeniiclostridium mannosilyticum]|jgi:HK97 family phage major capsid protein|uniref:Phage major capsid protein n=1 Tax=Hydrogeniiclostridium mannosilyticum TaxID=2764322 RepID=A0A328U7P3_9FIRM|nr:phage major capsid protein [Hydrogeniiclostridium mannosilyticum]RAQ21988.1 phage major capsid protein [Hydrogeniiclostridium mannosilyticum]DAK95595.1 MAG TPA: major capsid protein [Caudoviricetes sp.]DAU40127.1 MAG TPA: major capsid protein [Caudoviricetes sp.]
MRSNDILSREEIRGLLQKAIRENDTEGFYRAFDQIIECINQDIQQRYDAQVNDLKQEMDSRALAQRGVRQLTNKERDYYQKVAECMRSKDPKQALANADLVMPKTIMNAVFDELQTRHELLSLIEFIPTTGLTEMIMNTNGYQEAVWGKLCDDIVKELVSGFETIDMTLLKLSAFIPVCKAMLDLGPEWLDDYVRQVLYEALANGLEAGVVAGDGNEKPIGMNRQVGKGVTVTGGVYPEKAKISVTDLQPGTIGNLLSLIAVDPNGKPRTLRDVVMIVNPQDYFQKVMPATTLMAPDGTYRNDVMPYPMRIVQSMALDRGEAILGIAYKYFAGVGMGKEGRIEYDDSYHFLEDERMYLIKLYANGFPMDNNAFLFLDISALQPAIWKVEQVTPATPSNNAALSDLKIGSLTLDPAFTSETTTYTTTTSNATNTITATPADAKAAIEVKVGEAEVDNGSAATWQEGSNTVTIKVTAADGKTTKTYTVTVTKS